MGILDIKNSSVWKEKLSVHLASLFGFYLYLRKSNFFSIVKSKSSFLTFRSSPTCGFLFPDIEIASPWKNSVLDALFSLFFRSDISAETLWVGGWLLRQLLPYSVEDSSRYHPELLEEVHKNYINCHLGEVTEIRCDVLLAAIIDAWKKCKSGESSSFFWKKNVRDSQGYAGFRWIIYFYDSVKMHTRRSIGPATICHQIQNFSAGEKLPDLPSLCSSLELPVNSRAKGASLDVLGLNPGTEMNLAPCKIAFESGKGVSG